MGVVLLASSGRTGMSVPVRARCETKPVSFIESVEDVPFSSAHSCLEEIAAAILDAELFIFRMEVISAGLLKSFVVDGDKGAPGSNQIHLL